MNKRLQRFLYLLMRDHVPVSVVTATIHQATAATPDSDPMLSSYELRELADTLTTALTGDPKHPAASVDPDLQ